MVTAGSICSGSAGWRACALSAVVFASRLPQRDGAAWYAGGGQDAIRLGWNPQLIHLQQVHPLGALTATRKRDALKLNALSAN